MKNDIRYFDSPNIKNMQGTLLSNRTSMFHCESFLFDTYFRKINITGPNSGNFIFFVFF